MEDCRIKEYEFLREEILHADELAVRIMGVTLGLLGIILAQGFVSKEPPIFLVPFPIIWVISNYVMDKRWLIWTIAAYLRRHLEGPEGPSWESWLFALRSRLIHSDRKFKHAYNTLRVECVFFNIISISCGALFIYYGAAAGYSIPLITIISLFCCIFIWATTYFGYCRLFAAGKTGSPIFDTLPDGNDFRRAIEEIKPIPAQDLY